MAADLEVRYYQVPLATGLGSALFLWKPSATPRPLVVAMHGLGDDCTYPLWHWFDALTQAGYPVLSVDWDGHGISLPQSQLDLQIATRSLPLVLARLYQQPGRPQCYILGHSTGGALALLAACRDDVAQVAKGVVAVSPAVSVASRGRFGWELLQGLSPWTWVTDLAGRVPYFGVGGLVPPMGPLRRGAYPLRMRLDIPYDTQIRRFAQETFAVRRALRGVKLPVFWAHGKRDGITPLADVSPLMWEITSGLETHMDPWRGHYTLAMAGETPAVIVKYLNHREQAG